LIVSGFLISPNDHDLIFSGEAIEMRIWSNTWAGVGAGLKMFAISWFIVCLLGGPEVGRDRRTPFETALSGEVSALPPYSAARDDAGN
jgi:hypothetical protein